MPTLQVTMCREMGVTRLVPATAEMNGAVACATDRPPAQRSFHHSMLPPRCSDGPFVVLRRGWSIARANDRECRSELEEDGFPSLGARLPIERRVRDESIVNVESEFGSQCRRISRLARKQDLVGAHWARSRPRKTFGLALC